MKVSVQLNEAEIVSAKAALFEYARRLPKGERQQRALYLAKRLASMAQVFA